MRQRKARLASPFIVNNALRADCPTDHNGGLQISSVLSFSSYASTPFVHPPSVRRRGILRRGLSATLLLLRLFRSGAVAQSSDHEQPVRRRQAVTHRYS